MELFIQISLILVFATILSGIMRLLKQPLILGYVLTGVLLGPYFLNIFHSDASLNVFSKMGIAILLFIVGLHLSPSELKNFGKSAFLIGLLQVAFTTLFSFLISNLLSFNFTESIYISICLSFSSTIVVLKILSDKKDLENLYGRISIGILLLQDIVAALSLIVVSTFSSDSHGFAPYVLLVIKGLLLIISVSLVSYYVLPKMGSFFAKSQEYLFLFSISWGFGLATLSYYLGFSVEIGALIAGVALSISPYSSEISSRLKPLRDFFIVVFFILLGSEINIDSMSMIFGSFIILLLFILFIKPTLITVLMSCFGYNKKTSFMTGISLSQISEFSIILGMLGLSVGHINENTLNLITLLGIVSISISSYLITYSERLYPLFIPFLSLLERKNTFREKKVYKESEVILFGCNRAAYDFINKFKELGKRFLAVDFDPEIITELKSKHINCIYGDAEDSDFLEEINVVGAKLVVSTIPDYETNKFIVSKVRSINNNSLIFVLSYSVNDALSLYELGVTYVVLPHFVGGEFALGLAAEAGVNLDEFENKRKDHIQYLRKRKELGHAHPTWSHY